MDVTGIVAEYYDLWLETDAQARFARLVATVVDDIEYCDPGAQVVGAAAVNEVIGSYQAQFPGGRLELTSAIDLHHDVARFTWAFVGPEGERLADGIDVCQFAPDGRMTRLLVFFGENPPAVSGT